MPLTPVTIFFFKSRYLLLFFSFRLFFSSLGFFHPPRLCILLLQDDYRRRSIGHLNLSCVFLVFKMVLLALKQVPIRGNSVTSLTLGSNIQRKYKNIETHYRRPIDK